MPKLPKLPPIAGATGFIHHAEHAPAYWMQDILWIMLADREATGGRWSMMEQLLPRGSGPPPHKHLWSDETFYILDGEITFLVEDRIETAGMGAFVSIARATPPRLPGRHRHCPHPQWLLAGQYGSNGRRTRQAGGPAHAAAGRTACDRRLRCPRSCSPVMASSGSTSLIHCSPASLARGNDHDEPTFDRIGGRGRGPGRQDRASPSRTGGGGTRPGPSGRFARGTRAPGGRRIHPGRRRPQRPGRSVDGVRGSGMRGLRAERTKGHHPRPSDDASRRRHAGRRVPRFIPSDYSADFTRTRPGDNRNLDFRRAFVERIDCAPIKATSILNGAFMDMLGSEMPIIQPQACAGGRSPTEAACRGPRRSSTGAANVRHEAAIELPAAKPMAPSIRRPPVTLTPKDLAGRIKRGRVRIILPED